MKRPKVSRTIDIRHAMLEGGRLKVSARTTSKAIAGRRESALRRLMELGEWGILSRLRSRALRIEDVQRAVESGDLAELRARAGDSFQLGAECDRLLRTVEATATPGTLRNYLAILRELRRHFGDDADPGRITVDMAEAWLHAPKESLATKSRTARPWGAGRQRLATVICGRLWARMITRSAEIAEATGQRPAITRNPWKTAEVPDKPMSRQGFLSPQQWTRLLARVEGTPRAAIYALGALAGLRMGEALHLRTGVDVEFGGKGRIRVQPREGERGWKPKTRRSVRDVPMSAELRRILLAHIDEGYAGETYFIRGPRTDAPLSRFTVDRWVEADFNAAGMPYGRDGGGLTYHSLRHSAASWMAQRDVSLLKIAKILGDTVSMIEHTYGHLLPTDLDRAVEVLDQHVSEGGL